jgi:HK97 family phage major capsid protein
MKKSDELKQQRDALEAEIEKIVSKAERSADDNSAFDKLKQQLDELNSQIKRELEVEKFLTERAASAATVIGVKKDLNSYSFRKAIFEVAYRGGLTGLEKEMHEEALRADPGIQGIGVPEFIINSRTALAAASSAIVATETRDFIDALRAKLVVVQAGARLLTGLKGNLSIPYKSTAGSAAWETETSAADDAGMALSNHTMSPKRCSAYQTLSKQLLIQSSYDVEMMLRDDLIQAVAIAVDDAAIEGGAANTPTGILSTSGIGSVAGGTSGLAPSYAHIVQLEREVAVDNADTGALAFLTNPKVRAKLKTVAVGTDQRMVWGESANTLLGYPAWVTTQCPSDLTKYNSNLSAIIFGNFNDLMIGQWGGLDIIVDPYTAASTAQVNVYIHSFWDVLCRHAQSFAAMKDAITT